MIFDTHTHYSDPVFDEDREALLAGFCKAGVGRAVEVSASVSGLDGTLRLAQTHPQLYATVGVHPSECAEMTEETLAHMEELLSQPKAVAVGEIGLDYHWDEPDRETQKKWFRAQLALAARLDLPVVIHSRDAAQDTMEILREHRRGGGVPRESTDDGSRPQGVVHCYSYSPEQAREYVRMGYFIGIGGVVTFKNARKLREVVQDIPLGSLVLETDCPYMAPEPHRGERNSSLLLPLVTAKIAELKEISLEEVIRVTEKNAERLYGLD
ncbi:TatD family hydrolase [Lachnoclostridium sp. Marseille-P6806]|uniref:TatD family hydrolase n=1 Tax=Lachnoclostridium sp. Marseille-P6806 TaxID=2364793 RepID=UPI001032135A|nr:TatD family hydrolase [Lachnoclostridium sp. Marseille-P6806]